MTRIFKLGQRLGRTIVGGLFVGALTDVVGIVSGIHGIALAAEAPGQIVTYPSPGSKVRAFPGANVATSLQINNASVQITAGLAPNEDRLVLEYSGGAQIASSYEPATGILAIRGTAAGAEWGKILQSIHYLNAAANPNKTSRVIEAQLGTAKYLRATGHYYEMIRPQQPLSWNSAKIEASLRENLGLKGYLATITSPAEQYFVASLAAGMTAWLGANDLGTANSWRWVTGPEGSQEGGAGLAFYNANGPVAGQYNNWHAGYPTKSTTANFVGMAPGGYWASVTERTATNGYVVEYGGLGVTPSFFDRFSTKIQF